MNKDVQNFKKDVIERISRSYYNELLYFTASVPDALLNFNDVLLLKKKYVVHTNTLFKKLWPHYSIIFTKIKIIYVKFVRLMEEKAEVFI